MTTLTLELSDLAYGGDAVGQHNGRAVFVPLGIPGETVRVQVQEEHKRYARARLLDVLEPAPERVEPPCPYFGLCGGCHWQHIAYAAQLHFKRQIVLDQLHRVGKVAQPCVQPVIGMEDPWSYRNHVQFSLDREGHWGYQALRSHDIVPVEECGLTHPLLDELWEALDIEFEGLQRIVLRAGLATGEQMLILEGEDETPPEMEVDIPVSCVYQSGGGKQTVLVGSGHYHEHLAGRGFRVSAPSFFQVNILQAERLGEVVRRYLAIQPDERLLDAYCGVGVFALLAAGCGAHVLGIESSPWAIADAMANSTDEEDAEFIQGDVEEVLAQVDVACDAVVLDPPRAGCTPAVLQALAHCQPRRLVYVSCDPATLARDIAQLAQWGYTLVEVQPVDMFPQTYHIESVALLKRA
jgi:23S rRNA (uracil1939-C5)-methyltransferase